MQLRIGHLYGDEMNIYGDRGNIITLLRRAAWRGIEVQVEIVGPRSPDGFERFDLLFWGGGQDRDQALIFRDLVERKAAALRRSIGDGVVVLAVCGGYQLLGNYYVTADGQRIEGLRLIDLHTVPGPRRHIGNVLVDVRAVDLDPATLVGFENHSGRTYLGQGVQPLGRVLVGAGNNGEDGTEGVVQGNIYGTYLHGSLLPKNPHLADRLLELALRRQDAGYRLPPLDSGVELEAHHTMAARIQAGKVVHASAKR
jgi:CobQ-like glutamine amidotransferase family enzyme